MTKISELIVSQGQDVAKMEKFIKLYGDELTFDKGGCFDEYNSNTFQLVSLCDDFIVYVTKYQSWERTGGIGHQVTMGAWNLEMTKCWILGQPLSYRDQWDKNKDLQGPHPKKVLRCAANADGNLEVVAMMPDGVEERFILSIQKPKS